MVFLEKERDLFEELGIDGNILKVIFRVIGWRV
jgi:hypothetical protein